MFQFDAVKEFKFYLQVIAGKGFNLLLPQVSVF